MGQQTNRPEEIRSAVRERYARIARSLEAGGTGCCGPDASARVDVAVQALYEIPDVADLPPEITGLSLGCGDPVTLASLRPGETVLDLGAGGGIDCFLAARRVGPSGHVIGVDMTPEMVERARANARKIGLENVEFRLGEIEHLPVADESVDVIISNCVINLSPDKPQVFREAYRVLRPGGRLAVTDIVTRVELPPELRRDLSAWASCVAGAWVDADYVAAIEAAGFVQVKVEATELREELIADGAAQLGVEIDPAAIRDIVYSARVTAVKPKRDPAKL